MLPGALGADLSVSSLSSFAGLSDVLLQASGTIVFSGGAVALPALPAGVATGQLRVQAGTDIIIQDNTSISAGPGWSVSFVAGANPSAPGTANPGAGNITLEGTATLAASDGFVSLVAGNSVTVGAGFVHTVAGGGVSVSALWGSVNTGTAANGFVFLNNPATPCVVDPNLGGISTATGGDVTVVAGRDIVAFLPVGSTATDGGCGAFGLAAGNVLLRAGGNITGHYVVRNGTGTLLAGQNAGLASAPLALSLVTGSWTVTAAQDVQLQEIRNPNGIFNNLGPASSGTYHFFDYARDGSVSLTAGNAVHLLGVPGALPRRPATFDAGIGPIYPPTLNLSAGPGGIQMAADIRLFPSPTGQFSLATVNGGSLVSASPSGGSVQLILSDSANSRYTAASSFGPNDHAPTPVHLNDPVPASLDISGDLNAVTLVTAKPALVVVGGNMVNGGIIAQNLKPADVTSLAVAGDILNPASTADSGYIINGPGALNLTARNLDLGGSGGIQSVGPLNNHALVSSNNFN